MAILTPLSASLRAIPLAIPREAPVIRACFPFNDMSNLLKVRGPTGRAGSILLSAGPPVFRREFLKPFKISTAGIASRLRTLLHQLIQIGGKDGPNCMKSVMATQPLSLQAGERLAHHF